MQGLLNNAVQNVLMPNRQTLKEGWGSLIGRLFSGVSVLIFVCWQSGTTFIYSESMRYQTCIDH